MSCAHACHSPCVSVTLIIKMRKFLHSLNRDRRKAAFATVPVAAELAVRSTLFASESSALRGLAWKGRVRASTGGRGRAEIG